MRLVNLTPHELTIAGTTVPPSGLVARVSVEQKQLFTITLGEAEVPVFSQVYGAITDLPAPEEGVLYLASNVVRSALGSTRSDVLAPDTGPTGIREDGHIVGVTQLIGAYSSESK